MFLFITYSCFGKRWGMKLCLHRKLANMQVEFGFYLIDGYQLHSSPFDESVYYFLLEKSKCYMGWFNSICLSYTNSTRATLGSFNEITHPLEVRGRVFHQMGENHFYGTLTQCGLIDLEMMGGRFTWRRNIQGGVVISRKNLTGVWQALISG